MAKDELVGNIDTELLIHQLEGRKINSGIHKELFFEASLLAAEIFMK